MEPFLTEAAPGRFVPGPHTRGPWAEDSLHGRVFAPRIAEERARLAGTLGDAETQAAGLRAAREAYAAIGADGHAQRLATELG